MNKRFYNFMIIGLMIIPCFIHTSEKNIEKQEQSWKESAKESFKTMAPISPLIFLGLYLNEKSLEKKWPIGKNVRIARALGGTLGWGMISSLTYYKYLEYVRLKKLHEEIHKQD